MSWQPINQLRRRDWRDVRRWSETPLAAVPLAAVPLASLSAALLALLDQLTDPQPIPLRIPAVILLMMAAMLQTKILLRARRHGLPSAALSLYRQSAWRRWMLAGLVCCYAGSILLETGPEARYLFMVSIAVWYTAALVPLAAAGRTWRLIAATGRSRWTIRFGHLGFALAMLLPLVELGLRLQAWAVRTPVVQRIALRAQKLPPGSQWGAWKANAAGYCGAPFTTARRRGVFRLVAVGDETLLAGDATTNCLDLLRNSAGSLEVLRFALPGTGLDDYANVLAQDVPPYEPDLVIVFFSVADDVPSDEPAAGVFNRQELLLCQWGAAALKAHDRFADRVTTSPATSYETYLDRLAEQATLCGVPQSPATERRWQATFAGLERLLRIAEDHRLPLALAIAPAVYQVDDRLRTDVLRRSGRSAGRHDPSLPQRRLRRFAQERQLPVVDLLPCLRAAGKPVFERYTQAWNALGNRRVADGLAGWLDAEFDVAGAVDLATRGN